MTLFIVMTPSVTRSTPSISAIGGTSLCSKLRLALSGLPRYLAAMDEVVPPQTDVLALFREEERHHSVAVVGIARRAEERVHRFALAYLDNASSRIVSWMTAVELVALVNEHRRKRFRRVSDRTQART